MSQVDIEAFIILSARNVDPQSLAMPFAQSFKFFLINNGIGPRKNVTNRDS